MRRLGVVLDAHDVLSLGGRRLAVATHDNAVVEFGRFKARPVHVLPGEPDSWHLNCIEPAEGDLFASAFHRGGGFGEWSDNRFGSGCVFSLTTGAVVADGLSMPHSPRFCDGLWLVCDSAVDALVAIDPAHPSARAFTIKLPGFTRGLAFDEDHYFVGISARRQQGDGLDVTGSVAVVSRVTRKLVDRITVPAPEVYDVRLVPQAAAAMLAQPLLSDGGNRLAGQLSPAPAASTTASPGVPAGLSVRFVPPQTIRPGDVTYVSARIEHHGTEPLTRSEDSHVHLSYRWSNEAGSWPLSVKGEEPIRTVLPNRLSPGAPTDVDVVVRAPAVAGTYRLRVVFVDEARRWVDEEEPGAFSEMMVEVG